MFTDLNQERDKEEYEQKHTDLHLPPEDSLGPYFLQKSNTVTSFLLWHYSVKLQLKSLSTSV